MTSGVQGSMVLVDLDPAKNVTVQKSFMVLLGVGLSRFQCY